MAQARRTTTQRGLGAEHQARRKWLLDNHVDGSLCVRCGQPMWKDEQQLDADHTVPRSQGGTKADRLLHASCNRSRGDGTRDTKAAEDRAKWTTLDWV